MGKEVHTKQDVLPPVILVHGEGDHLLDKEVVEWRLPKLLHQYRVCGRYMGYVECVEILAWRVCVVCLA